MICSNPPWLITTSVFAQSPPDGNVSRTDAGRRSSPAAVMAEKSDYCTTVCGSLQAAKILRFNAF